MNLGIYWLVTMGDFGDWYRTIPLITRYWFTGATIIPLLGRLGIFSPYLMLLDWNLFFNKFQARYVIVKLALIFY